jgi:hypothetical protein
VVEGTSQALLRSSDQQKVPANLSLFLKSEKIPALLYIGKGLESTGPSVIFDLFPWPTGLPGAFYRTQACLDGVA